MPENIISQWLNLSSVKFVNAITNDGRTEIYLSRDRSLGFVCSNCGRVVPNTWRWRKVKIRDLSVFEFKTYLVFTKYRVNCQHCGTKVENLNFIEPCSRCTIRFEELVARLCKITTISQVAKLLGLDWKTVKNIDKKYLEKQFAIPDYENLRLIAVDEISSRKGYNFFTVVMNLEKTKVIWVGKERKKETLDQFFKELGPQRAKQIEAVAMDMWDPYISSTKEHAPQAEVVFDKFHVIKTYSQVIDKVRNDEFYKAEKEDKEIIKGTKYLLLKNAINLKNDQKRELRILLNVNENINLTYILKDDLKRLWDYKYPGCAERFLDSWISRAISSGIQPLIAFAITLDKHRNGLISHCRYNIDTAKLEGMNNKIKVIKRMAYGFHDDDYFILKIKQGCGGFP